MSSNHSRSRRLPRSSSVLGRTRDIVPVVGLLSLEIHLPGTQSLKEKRSIIRSVKDRIRRLNVSIAEIDYQDLWQRCLLGVVAVGATQTNVEQALKSVEDEIERHDPGLVVAVDINWLL